MTGSKEYIQNHIHHHGPMSIEVFMDIALAHPKHGYYMNRDPLGVEGDFTTAPEISQIFGELLGAWVADGWIQCGKPDPFLLIECGPGRGTLMSDMLRATKNVAGFHAALRINLVETSPVLKEKQKHTLSGYDVAWHKTLDCVENGLSFALLANEFLDALPIRQLQKKDGLWCERVVGLDDDGALMFGLGAPLDLDMKDDDGAIMEISSVRESFVRQVSNRLIDDGGFALFVDYGHTKTASGDTLQAVKNHEFIDVLACPGEADLTSHVDFEALTQAGQGTTVHKPVTQGEFLTALGISQRAAMLKQNATKKQAGDIDDAVKRLTAPEGMGELFKVMAFAGQSDIKLAGF